MNSASVLKTVAIVSQEFVSPDESLVESYETSLEDLFPLDPFYNNLNEKMPTLSDMNVIYFYTVKLVPPDEIHVESGKFFTLELVSP